MPESNFGVSMDQGTNEVSSDDQAKTEGQEDALLEKQPEAPQVKLEEGQVFDPFSNYPFKWDIKSQRR